jgi:hypothetical protein
MVVGDYREDGTEDLLPGDAHVATDVGDDRRSHPEPVREFINAHCSAAERHGRALRTCAFDVTEDAVALFGVDGRAQVSIPIPGGPNDNRLRSRPYAVDAHGNESLAVARAAGKAADDIERVQSELRTLRADATELQMTIDGLTNTVVPTSSCLPTEALIAEMQLQPRLDAILAEANAVDAELATAINIADGDTPIPPGPHDNRPEIQNALSQPLPEDPIKFADLWNQLTRKKKTGSTVKITTSATIPECRGILRILRTRTISIWARIITTVCTCPSLSCRPKPTSIGCNTALTS